MGVDNYWVCPYDTVHVMKNTPRIQQHLIKCSKNHPEKNLIWCPYNATHRLKEEELAAHIVNCPERAIAFREGNKGDDFGITGCLQPTGDDFETPDARGERDYCGYLGTNNATSDERMGDTSDDVPSTKQETWGRSSSTEKQAQPCQTERGWKGLLTVGRGRRIYNTGPNQEAINTGVSGLLETIEANRHLHPLGRGRRRIMEAIRPGIERMHIQQERKYTTCMGNQEDRNPLPSNNDSSQFRSLLREEIEKIKHKERGDLTEYEKWLSDGERFL